MDDTGYPISPSLGWNTLRMQSEGLFRPWPILLPPAQNHLFRSDGQKVI
jgi:hypothetical protein